MVGVSTDMCVETRAREAANGSYAVTLVEDGYATTHPEQPQGTLRNFACFFGTVRSTAEALKTLRTVQAEAQPAARSARYRAAQAALVALASRATGGCTPEAGDGSRPRAESTRARQACGRADSVS